MDVEGDDMPGTVTREISDRKPGQNVARLGQHSLGGRDAEETQELSPRVSNALLKAHPIQKIKRVEILGANISEVEVCRRPTQSKIQNPKSKIIGASSPDPPRASVPGPGSRRACRAT